MSMNNYLMKDHPCKRECPDRKPGCNCEKRKEFLKIKEERKEKIRKHKETQSMLDEISIPSNRRNREK